MLQIMSLFRVLQPSCVSLCADSQFLGCPVSHVLDDSILPIAAPCYLDKLAPQACVPSTSCPIHLVSTFLLSLNPRTQANMEPPLNLILLSLSPFSLTCGSPRALLLSLALPSQSLLSMCSCGNSCSGTMASFSGSTLCNASLGRKEETQWRRPTVVRLLLSRCEGISSHPGQGPYNRTKKCFHRSLAQ